MLLTPDFTTYVCGFLTAIALMSAHTTCTYVPCESRLNDF